MRHTHSLLGFALAGAIVLACGGSTVGPAVDGGVEDGGATTDGGDEHACKGLLDCALAPTGCCGCGESASEVDAVAVSSLASRPDRCAGIACGPCAEPSTPFERDQLVAQCRAERCVVEDVRTSDLSGCASDSDCVLEHAGCCACSTEPLVVLNRSQLGLYRQLACTGMMGACPPCLPPPPTGWDAYCSPQKQCAGRPAAVDAGRAPDGG